jgi:hypothetical protein
MGRNQDAIGDPGESEGDDEPKDRHRRNIEGDDSVEALVRRAPRESGEYDGVRDARGDLRRKQEIVGAQAAS